MKRSIPQLLLAIALLAATALSAQVRYHDEVFTDDEIMVQSNVVFATNIDFLTSNFAGANTVTDLTTLHLAADAGMPYAPAYFDPTDASTDVKVANVAMDIYHPDNAIDDVDMRPVIIYVHTGNFLPPPLNGAATGQRTDSVAVELCRQWAKRGYVAASVDYRLGWNPLAETIQERRGTLLNAVYRAIHDIKMGVRYLRADAMDQNTYEIDESRMVVYGQGSGGYVATSYSTLDNAPVELFLEKFLLNPFDPSSSYVDTLSVGNIDGWGYSILEQPTSVNLYRDNGVSADVHMAINAGGAMADESWLEADDIPMVSLHCVRDDFAPFTEGTVIVSTTGEEVVDIHGSNFFIQKANDLGINDVFADLPDGNPFTDAARSHYGVSYDGSNSQTITVNDTPEGLFPFVRPLAGFLQNESAPWEWWDPAGPIPSTVIDEDLGITAHMASLASNPDMSPEKGRAYVDSIQGYILPRIMCVLDLPNNPCANIALEPMNDECVGAMDISGLFGQAIGETQYSSIQDNTNATVEYDTDNPEDVADCWGEGSFDVEPVMNATMWFSFTGDGNEYTIETGDCNGDASDYIDFGDTQFQLFTGDCAGGLVPVAAGCSEDSENAVTDDYFAGLDFMTEDGTDYYLMVDGFNGVGVDEVGVLALGEYCIEVTSLAVSVEETDAASFALFPNPASERVLLKSAGGLDQVVVMNAVGQEVLRMTRPGNANVEIDLSTFEAGIYLVTVEAAGAKRTQRLIVE